MKKISTLFPEVWVIEPNIFKDGRGFFYESYSYNKFSELGINTTFVQDNHSKSIKNTVRGLHFQSYPGQVKMVRCTKGKIWDVAVDIRPNSKNYKKWIGVELSDQNFKMVYVPIGFAHGFSVLSDFAEVQYKVSNHYDKKLEMTIKWNDPSIQIDWKVKLPILSERDENAENLDVFLKHHPDSFNP